MGMLVVIEGKNKGAVYKLGQRVLTIGRGPVNLIQLLDPGVSRRHASLWWKDGGYQITDLESRNGVYVNDVKVKQARLNIEDRIRIGSVLFKLVEDMEEVEDQVLKARNPNKKLVSHTTMFLDEVPAGLGMAGRVVDIDKAAHERDADMKNRIDKYSSMATEKAHKTDLMTETLSYALRTVDADRCMAFQLTGPRNIKLKGIVFSDDVSPGERKLPPIKTVLNKAFKTMGPVSGRSDGRIYAGVAIPLHIGIKPVGILYADCLVENPRVFIEQDIEILNMVAPAVVSAMQQQGDK